jgi:hypothetical protein
MKPPVEIGKLYKLNNDWNHFGTSNKGVFEFTYFQKNKIVLILDLEKNKTNIITGLLKYYVMVKYLNGIYHMLI